MIDRTINHLRIYDYGKFRVDGIFQTIKSVVESQIIKFDGENPWVALMLTYEVLAEDICE
jgi:hypothetical protein